jgi:hypothetical protein
MSHRDKGEKGGKNLGGNLDDVKRQLLVYENQIKDYLDNIEAHVEGYKFSIEKQGDALVIDIALKAKIQLESSKR